MVCVTTRSKSVDVGSGVIVLHVRIYPHPLRLTPSLRIRSDGGARCEREFGGFQATHSFLPLTHLGRRIRVCQLALVPEFCVCVICPEGRKKSDAAIFTV